ncbi:metalloregulator ArsR/SmtB family transcription factor [Cytobacillus spongiae]|jgi:ArsR family transcriptional regulator|uniref:ArsR/SmtB family transcription factor n=1 Tax=Cytobacillus spongiae TaxID=2901381 RepID=UPI001F436903|nr:metalloregulator ArsR/SmtB family transcription factor [Cytobacillus spongiae]UII56263.1 metalloregulator ArsR/SmtB family transcription factor [Cytobacillus spongiae]
MEVEKVANILKLLGDKTRLTMMGLLLENECCVCEFVEIFQMSQPAISQHLRKLKDSGLVKEKRRSQWVIYSLNPESEYYGLLKDLLQHIPDQKEKLDELDRKGLRISCE